MNTERDKFLTEQMGECSHMRDHSYWNGCKCLICGCEDLTRYKPNNFSTWDGFGKLWEWSMKQKGFWEYNCEDLMTYMRDYVNPNKFADYVYSYLKSKEK